MSGGGRRLWMAKTNKYASLNFNDIYENKITTTSNHHPSSTTHQSSTNKTVISNSRIHGNMLVLTRPSPKPIVQPPSATQPTDQQHQHQHQHQTQPPVEPDSISLRPLGRTGSTFPLVQIRDSSVSLKTNNKFVPPHLRPGFHGREEKPEPEIQKQTGLGLRSSSFRQSPREEGRPKSGGGYERVRGGFEVNSVAMNRPRFSGSNGPYSSG